MHRLIKGGGVAGLLLLVLSLAGCGNAPAAPAGGSSGTSVNGANAVVFRSPTCGCCHEHEEYMSTAGIKVHSVLESNMANIKQGYGVPAEMSSCHTTDIGGYFVEGHVPLGAIEKLLAETPDLDGIALPGMPAGSPGMGGRQDGPLTVYGIKDGAVVSVFGEY